MRWHHFIKDILRDTTHIACLKHLQNQPGLSGRELAKLTKVSQFKIRIVLDNLSRQGLLKRQVVGRAHLYTLNTHHFLVEKIKPLLEIEEDFFTFVGAWIRKRVFPKPLSIILFGSVARGEERSDSDVDLLFIYKKGGSQEKLAEKIQEAIADSLEYFGNRFAPVLTTPLDFQKAIKTRDPFFLQILKEGFVIAGATMNEVLL